MKPSSPETELGRLQQRLAATQAERDRLRRQLTYAAGGLDATRAARAAAQARRDRAEAEQGAALLQQRIAALEASTSWRLTVPLRRLAAAAPQTRRLPRVAAKLVWWTVSLQLGARLRARREFLAARLHEAEAAAPRDLLSEPADIVVCVHNAMEDVRRCLSSVVACTAPPYRLIIVDDGSDGPTRDMLAAFAAAQGAVLVRNEAAGGYTRAANQGMRRADAPWVVLLNSDTVVTLGWLERMKERASVPSVGVVGPLSNIASWQSAPAISAGGDWPENPLPDDIDIPRMGRLVAEHLAGEGVPLPFLNGFCLLLRKAMLDEVGLFDEETFGAGYGEENDFCIRARNAGWGLVVATDVFVHHAQSRSYSSERRLQLAARADAALAAKHDAAREIGPQVGFCVHSLAMASARTRFAAAVERHRLVREGERRWAGRRLAVVLPLITSAGGGEVVIQELRALRRMGVDASLVNFGRHVAPFERAYPDLDLPVLYVEDEAEIPGLLDDPAHRFDAVVATLYKSAFWLPRPRPGLRRAYYVQDYEPLFFEPGDPERELALRSYTHGDDVLLFTKTVWNADQVEAGGAGRPTLVGASVDLDRFRPEAPPFDRPPGPVRVCAMVRPSTARRGPKRTAEVLRALQQRFAGAVQIEVFGVGAREALAAGLDLQGMSCLGELDRAGMAALLARSAVFLDLSDYQAMGLTALEAMASGCAVVVPAAGGAVDFVRNEENGLLVDTSDTAACLAAAGRLVADEDLRRRLQMQALADVARLSPERAAYRIMECLFGEEGP